MKSPEGQFEAEKESSAETVQFIEEAAEAGIPYAEAFCSALEEFPALEPLISNLVQSSLEYSVARQRLARLSKVLYHRDEDKWKENAERYDGARKRKHEVLIDDANILSRAMKKHGLDISWRQDLLDRDALGDWAANFSSSIKTEQGV